MTDHTVKSFTEQLEALSALVAQMGGLAEAQFAAAIEAIARRDSVAAESAVGGDARIDEVQQEIEDRALKLLALRQPMAVDLRETLAAIKTAAELERIGDLAKNIAKRALVLNREPPIRLTQSLARMGKRGAGPVEAGAGRLFQPQRRAGRSGVEPGRRDRRNLQQPVPRASHLHDGRPAHHRALHPSSVRRQEYRAQRRPLPPTSPRWSITWCAPTISPPTGPRPTSPAKPPFPSRPSTDEQTRRPGRRRRKRPGHPAALQSGARRLSRAGSPAMARKRCWSRPRNSPIWCCWTGCCRSFPASRSAAACAAARKPATSPSSC